MPPPVAKPPIAKPASPPSSNPPVPPAGEPISALPPGRSHVERLRNTLAIIDQTPGVPSQTRAVLGGYYRVLMPHATAEHIPQTVRPHAANPERCMYGSGIWPLLYFHMGQAAFALHAAYKYDGDYVKIPDAQTDRKLNALARVEDAVKVLEDRTATLEMLAKAGPLQWKVWGDDVNGYRLLTAEDHKHAYSSRAEAEKTAEAKLFNPHHRKRISGFETPEAAD